MLTQPESACLLIGDISGYTGFLASVELDHAHDIIADLMATIVCHCGEVVQHRMAGREETVMAASWGINVWAAVCFPRKPHPCERNG